MIGEGQRQRMKISTLASKSRLNELFLFAKALVLSSVLMVAVALASFISDEIALMSKGTALLAPPAFAQAEKKQPVYVKVELKADTTAIEPGKEFGVAAVFTIEPHWHIYYKDCGEAGMPTKIDWKLSPGFTAGPLLWEKPTRFNDAGITTFGYSDKTVIATRITPPANLAAGTKVKIDADIKWLSCKDICLPGGTTVSLELPVATDGAQPANQEVFTDVGFTGSVEDLTGGDTTHKTSAATTDLPSQEKGSVSDMSFKPQGEEKKESNPLFYFGFAIIGGLILNFMPCVLPVISIKILSFVQQADEEPKRVRLLGLTFAAGIISAFMVLATIVLLVRQAGQSVGWGFQFQYPGFVIVMCVIVLLLALSLFGLFYVSFSAGQDKLDNLASKEGYPGTFFKGVLATTLSTPCTAPFLGTALGFAFAQPAWVVLGIFFASGLGMSLPYILLTLNPGWMKFMPKPGVWMEKFKESMGFILLATVIWLLNVLGSQIGTEGVMWTSFFLLTVALASWIVSRYTDLTSSNKRKTIVWSIASLVTLAGFVSFIFLQPSVVLALDPSSTSSERKTEKVGETNWKPFSIEALDEAIHANNTVFLDFTADWCLTCKLNEKAVLSTKEVESKFKELKVLTMKADWTRQDPAITKLLSKFNRSGVPLYVIFPAGKASDPIVLPEVITQSLVLEALDKAGASKPFP